MRLIAAGCSEGFEERYGAETGGEIDAGMASGTLGLDGDMMGGFLWNGIVWRGLGHGTSGYVSQCVFCRSM